MKDFDIAFFCTLLFSILKKTISETGKEKGAYLSVPDSSNLQYRLGNNLGYIGNGWDDARMSNLSSLAGYDGQRKKLPQQHLVKWGYGIEIDDCKTNTKLGILDVVGYLATPLKNQSSNKTDNEELCYPLNLYEPIWLGDGTVNPNNYWAYYVYKTVSSYKNYIKIWETWNEPDYTRNTNNVGNWMTSPPNPEDLSHWYGTIFEYIRLLRVTYEVAKSVDPDCFVATGGIGYSEFLDGILRYTDNPTDGTITNDYPAYGGAYFDCDAYHQYPKYGVTDLETNEGYHKYGSDMLAKKVVILKKNHEYILKNHGFDGISYPKKIFVNTETGVNSEQKGSDIGGDLVRRNWILKLALFCIEYDVKQVHLLNLADDGKGMGDYANLGQFISIEEGFKKLKSSSKGRIILKKINLGKFEFDESKTTNFRNSLQSLGATGIVLRRKFPKESNEEYFSDYIYSAWIYCEEEEIDSKVEINLNLDFDPLTIDWMGNQKNIKKDSKLNITSTPIFLIENNGNYPDSVVLDGDIDDLLNKDTDGKNETTSGKRRRSSSVNLSLKKCIIVLSLFLLI